MCPSDAENRAAITEYAEREEERIPWDYTFTGAIIGLILGIVLTLATFPGWAC